MSLRVTQGMLHSQMLRNINNNVGRLDKYQEMQSTGRKINKPSDDAVGITYALRYRSEISMNEQYQKNLDMAKSLVEHSDTTLGQIGDVLLRVKELTVQGVNGTNLGSPMKAIATELEQLYQQMVSLGNDQLNGRYIFNGQFTDKLPYPDGVLPQDAQSDPQLINYKFAAGVTIPINITGNEVFGPPVGSAGDQGDNMFAVIKGLADAFNSDDTATASSLLVKLEQRFQKVLDVRSDVGARANRIDLIDNRLKDLDLNLNELSGKTEDADMAEVIMNLKMAENVYQASLSTGAKVIQPSLVDFLR
ncbi:flagellar hook-associated protein FlgL [Paenibacillus albiflavus]|uniref:Flagellar hook-associated protein FlgL n=1 Tax=Paenibacillus albiflavus TaxID=2545760 RepID=A0A4V2WNU2_9BACL|nr:flagellar hook-associated protein FlgL [Paenibacillus albiflavus]